MTMRKLSKKQTIIKTIKALMCTTVMMMLVALPVKAEAALSGMGTSEDPYLIETSDDWDTFASNVNGGNDYSGKYVKLADSISVTTMVGTSENPFDGIFDGNNKTLTVNITGDSDYIAPFRFVNNSEINNLTVAGTINTGDYRYGAGLIGRSKGTAQISNCKVDAAIKSTLNGIGYHGGFAGEGDSVNFNNCVFSGELLGLNTRCCAGFIGYYNGMIVFNDCLFAPSSITMKSDASNTYCLGTAYFYNALYTQSYGSKQGWQAYTTEQESLCRSSEVLGNTYYADARVTININQTYKANGNKINVNPIVYYSDEMISNYDDKVNHTIENHYSKKMLSKDNYTVKITNDVGENVTDNLIKPGTYTLTISGVNEKGFYGSYSKEFTVVYAGLEGEGTEESPYLINTNEDWEIFVNSIAAGDSYSGEYVQLANDIEVSTMAGTAENQFDGIFDGNGKTMTVSLNNDSKKGTAPFCYIKAATIKNLTVDGTIISSKSDLGGVVAYVSGSSIIEGCTVKADLKLTSDDCYAGGIIGCCNSAFISLKNCIFAGEFDGNSKNTKFAGIIMGITRDKGDDKGTCTYLENCFEDGTYSNVKSLNPVYMKVTIASAKNCCYRNECVGTSFDQFAAKYFKKLFEGAQPDFCNSVKVLDKTYCCVGDITIELGNYKQSVERSMVKPVVTYNESILSEDNYTISFKDSNSNYVMDDVLTPGTYTLIISGVNAKGYFGTAETTFKVSNAINGAGTKESPYLIESTSDWTALNDSLTDGASYSGEYVKLVNDIAVTTMVGTSENPFDGIFDGNNKTLTVNITGSEVYIAPFRYVNDATIRNLTVAGTINADAKNCGGLIASLSGNVTVDNCKVTVQINSDVVGDGSHGGFAGQVESKSYVEFNNCIFAGKLLGEDTTSCGGFVGWNSGAINYNDCVFVPGSIRMSSYDSCTFNRNANTTNSKFNNCYYTQPFGQEQGTLIYDEQQEGFGRIINLSEGKVFYGKEDTSINVKNKKFTGGNIDVVPTVLLGNAKVNNDGYTVSIKDATGNDVNNLVNTGTYTLTIEGVSDKGYYGTASATFAVEKADALSVGDITKKYKYCISNTDTVDIAEKFNDVKSDAGTCTYTIVGESEGEYEEAPSVTTEGVLNYKVKAGKTGDEGTIKVKVASQNYEDTIVAVKYELVTCNHEKLASNKTESVPNTCTDDGNNEYYTCPDCGRYFADAQGQTEIQENSWITKKHGHEYKVTDYSWSDDGKECVATAICTHDATHVITERATITTTIKEPATCENMGVTTYKAVFKNDTVEGLFEEQTKDVKDIPAIGHDYKVSKYAWSKDGKTCVATATCTHDEKHVITETATVSKTTKTEATYDQKGVSTYTAVFSNKIFEMQTKEVVDIPALEGAVEKVGARVSDQTSGFSFVVTSSDDDCPEIAFVKTSNTEKTVVIPETITVNGVTYTVTSIADNAFKNNKNVEKIIVENGIKSIGKNAFKNTTNLKFIIIDNLNLTSKNIKKNAFKGVGKKVVIKVPKKKKKAYTKLFRKKGLSKKNKIKQK